MELPPFSSTILTSSCLKTEPKLDNGGASSSADSRNQGTSVEPVKKSPPMQSNLSARDLWQDAPKQLPGAKQEKLKCMGFGQLNPGSVEASIYGLVGEVNQKQKQCEEKFWRVSIKIMTLSFETIQQRLSVGCRRLVILLYNSPRPKLVSLGQS